MMIKVPIIIDVPDEVEDVVEFLDECSVVVSYKEDGDDLHRETRSEEFEIE